MSIPDFNPNSNPNSNPNPNPNSNPNDIQNLEIFILNPILIGLFSVGFL